VWLSKFNGLAEVFIVSVIMLFGSCGLADVINFGVLLLSGCCCLSVIVAVVWVLLLLYSKL